MKDTSWVDGKNEGQPVRSRKNEDKLVECGKRGQRNANCEVFMARLPGCVSIFAVLILPGLLSSVQGAHHMTV